jgi:nicotinamidase-related amidase
VDPKQTALVLIEYQHDFTSEGGALHGAVKDVMARSNMLANTVATIAAARAAGVLIAHAPITFAPGYPELSPRAYGILKGARDAGAFQKGSWGAEIVADVAPVAGDIVVEGKRGLDAFATTNLDFILRMRGIATVALGGFLTNCCVESTMRTAYELGYNVVTLIDCTAATSEEEQQAATTKDYPMFSHPMPHTDFLAMIGDQAAGAEASGGYLQTTS